MLKKDSFEWIKEAQKAFDDCKRAMTQALVLALLDFTIPFIIYADASGDGIGVVLVQEKRLLFLFPRLWVQ